LHFHTFATHFYRISLKMNALWCSYKQITFLAFGGNKTVKLLQIPSQAFDLRIYFSRKFLFSL